MRVLFNIFNILKEDNISISLNEFYDQYKETITRINNLKLEPSINSQQNIIEYSGSFKFESIR